MSSQAGAAKAANVFGPDQRQDEQFHLIFAISREGRDEAQRQWIPEQRETRSILAR